MVGSYRQMFDCPIREQNSKLACVILMLPQCLLDLLPNSLAITWVEPFSYGFVTRKALQWIKRPNSVALL